MAYLDALDRLREFVRGLGDLDEGGEAQRAEVLTRLPEFVQTFTGIGEPTSEAWRLVEVEGQTCTECPHCLAVDMIAERDTAIRYNPLLVSDDGSSVIARLGESGDWDHDGWICLRCWESIDAAPDGFRISDWL